MVVEETQQGKERRTEKEGGRIGSEDTTRLRGLQEGTQTPEPTSA